MRPEASHPAIVDGSFISLILPFTLANAADARIGAISGVDLFGETIKRSHLLNSAHRLVDGSHAEGGPLVCWRTITGGVDTLGVDGLRCVIERRSLMLTAYGAGALVLDLRPADAAAPFAAWADLCRAVTKIREPFAADTTDNPPTLCQWSDLTAEILGVLRLPAGSVDCAPHPIAYSCLLAAEPPEGSIRAMATHLAQRLPASASIVLGQDELSLLAVHDSAYMYAGNRSLGYVGPAFEGDDAGYLSDRFPLELRNHFLFVALLTVVQRTALADIAGDALAHWTTDDRRRTTAIAELRGRTARVAAGGALTEVMDSRLQTRWQHHCQKELRIHELFDDVNRHLADLSDDLLVRSSRRLEHRVAILGAFVGVPSLVFSFLGIAIDGLTAPNGLSAGASLSVVLLALTLGVIVGATLTTGDRMRTRNRSHHRRPLGSTDRSTT